MIDIIKLLRDANVMYTTEGKNVQSGWLGVRCPFCGDHSDHGGFRIEKTMFSCWRCGHHKVSDALARLLNISTSEAVRLLKRYSTTGTRRIVKTKRKKPKTVNMPPYCGALSQRHRRYLEARNFDPDRLVELFGIQGTSHLGAYKHRIVAPIIEGGALVSFQARDITGKSKMRYKACAKEHEAVHHKETLYNIDAARNFDSVIVVEGITDVWRLGAPAVATFGTSYTLAQAVLLAQWRHRFIVYDAEAEAQAKAQALARDIDLCAVGRGMTEIITLPELEGDNDLADLSDDEAAILVTLLTAS